MIWGIVTLIFVAGFVGGLFNALVTDGGFAKPRLMKLKSGKIIWRPGWLGNILIGGLTAFLDWSLDGPVAHQVVIGSSTTAPEIVLTVGNLANALIIGLGGSYILAKIMEKRADKAASENVATGLAILREIAGNEVIR